jgi:putative flippase GtrA
MPESISPLRHYGGFVAAGLSAMAVDAGILAVLTKAFGMTPLGARVISILVAMVVSWAINRWIAFAVAEPPTWREFGRFAAACSASITVNYLVFAAILWAFPAVWPPLAIVPASAVSMFVSYAGFRFGAFRAAPPPT